MELALAVLHDHNKAYSRQPCSNLPSRSRCLPLCEYVPHLVSGWICLVFTCRYWVINKIDRKIIQHCAVFPEALLCWKFHLHWDLIRNTWAYVYQNILERRKESILIYTLFTSWTIDIFYCWNVLLFFIHATFAINTFYYWTIVYCLYMSVDCVCFSCVCLSVYAYVCVCVCVCVCVHTNLFTLSTAVNSVVVTRTAAAGLCSRYRNNFNKETTSTPFAQQVDENKRKQTPQVLFKNAWYILFWICYCSSAKTLMFTQSWSRR